MAFATLKFWHDRFIWTSPQHVGGITSRPAIAILVGGWGELYVEQDSTPFRGRVIAVGPNVLRSISAPKGFYSLNLDPVHAFCRSLREGYFARAGVWDLSERISETLLEEVAQAIHVPAACDAAYRLSDRLLARLFPDIGQGQPIDERIRKVADWLRTQLPTKAVLPELCALCGLSQSRLTHLFTQEMGVSIKSYLLAMKMRRAAEWFGQDRTLTEIAHGMGFTDSAHLSKAFQAYFSVPPSLLANRQLVDIQVGD